ncbi:MULTISPECIES: LysR family transcriptional regulator [Brevibacterium]|jgi:DNA-binding transcriptional LysR family regulator|uniref:LysR substrate-binding domain-containing protein n=1 Tax=Brevibacterium salitolerans TaxID=1403566 RepID=A0ABN2WPW1_9MICO|nr:LysR substrate-binding domain-containing protein [Brevibacterium sp.]
MELQQIRAFLAVAEELHFGRAAERLGMAQPPLSRTIRQFEKELGAELFHRTTRQVALAPAGEALVGPARALLEASETAEQAVHFAAAGDTGRVRLGFGGYSSALLAARLTRAVRHRKPGITMELESSIYTKEALDRLRDGTIDLALVRWQTQPPHIYGRPVMIDQPVVAVYGSHRFARRTSVRVEELADESFILLPSDSGSTMRELISRWCHRAGFEPRVVQEVADSWIIGALISTEMGITISYDSVTAGFNHPGVVSVPLEVGHDDPIVVYLAHREPPSSPALREVLTTAATALPTIEVPTG